MSEVCPPQPNRCFRYRFSSMGVSALLLSGCMTVQGEAPPPKPPMKECEQGLRRASEFIIDQTSFDNLLQNDPVAWDEMRERVDAKLRDSNIGKDVPFSVETAVLIPGSDNPDMAQVGLRDRPQPGQAATLGRLASLNLNYYTGPVNTDRGGDASHVANLRLEEYCTVEPLKPDLPPEMI